MCRFAITISLITVLCTGIEVSAQDWSSRGGASDHNPVITKDKWLVDFKLSRGGDWENVKWFREIGMGLESEPAISDGLVWVGGSNSKPRDPKVKGDAGVLFCFRESDGKFLYQYVSPRRAEGSDYDWPGYGIASTPFVDKDRIYFCTNRCEIVCLDIGPLLAETGMPKEVWKVDMVKQFGVLPSATHIGSRHLHCSPAVSGDYVYVNTTHMVPSYKMDLVPKGKPAPPSLICFNKQTGQVKWSDNTPGNEGLGPQWNNPTIIRVNDREQVVMGQSDGWVRSFDCLSGELIWKFDMNKKIARQEFQARNQFSWRLRQAIAEPVFCNGKLFVVGGYEYEFGAVTGRLCCIDPKKTGDISIDLVSTDKAIKANPNSGLIWEFNGSPSGTKGLKADADNPDVMHSSLGSVAVHKGFVVAADLAGSVHCLDEKTGKRHWSYDSFDLFFGSPLIMGKNIIVNGEDGFIYSIPLSSVLKKDNIRTTKTFEMLHSSPVYANNTVYFTSFRKLFAIECRDRQSWR